MYSLTHAVLSMYVFGLDSFKPWLVASGMDVSRSVNKKIFSYISVKISTLSHYFIEAYDTCTLEHGYL